MSSNENIVVMQIKDQNYNVIGSAEFNIGDIRDFDVHYEQLNLFN